MANKFNVTRNEQDSYAAQSQQLAENSQKQGYFDDEIVPVPVTSKSATIIFDKDEYPKHGTTESRLSQLKPCFIKVKFCIFVSTFLFYFMVAVNRTEL